MGLMMNAARGWDQSGLKDTRLAEGNTQEPFLEAAERLCRICHIHKECLKVQLG